MINGGWLPQPGPQRALVASSSVNRLGTGMFLASSALYFTLIVGIPAREVGAGLTAAGVVGLLAGVPAGYLADRMGPRTVQLATLAAQTVTMAAFAVVHCLWQFVLVAALDRLADSANDAARGAVIGRVGGDRPAVFRAQLRTFVSIAAVLGTLIAAFAIQIGTRDAYVTLILINAGTSVACGLLLLRVPNYPPLPKPQDERKRFSALADKPYLTYAMLSGLLNLERTVVALIVPLWIAAHARLPHWTAAAVFALNFLAAVLLTQRVGRRVQTIAQGGKAMRVSGLATAAGCALLTVTGSGPAWTAGTLLFAGVAVMAFGGVCAMASGFSLSFGLAPEHAHGQYQGVYMLGMDGAEALGPVLLTTLVLGQGAAGWLVLTAGFAAVGLLGPTVTAWAHQSRARYAGFALEAESA